MRLRAKTDADNSPCGDEGKPGRDKGVNRLRCLNCGQHIFVAAESEPPEICQYCADMTTWRLIEG